MRRSENGVREPRKSPGAPKNKLLGTNIEEKARYVVEEQDVMRSHYCRTNSRRLYMPEGTTIVDLFREFKRSLLPTENVPSSAWFYNFMGTNYNIGTQKPQNNRYD